MFGGGMTIVKGCFSGLMTGLKAPDAVSYTHLDVYKRQVYYHPGRRAVLAHDNERFAALGEIHPDVAARFDIDGRVYVLEVDLTALMAMAKPIYGVKELPRFPAVSRDIAIVVKEAARAGDMLLSLIHI